MKISQDIMNPIATTIPTTIPTNMTSRNEISRTDNVNINDVQDKQAISSEQQNSKDKTDAQSKEVIRAIEEANKKIKGNDKQFEFAVHEQTKQIMVKVIDTKTHEVLKEFPSEKILDMVANMCEAAGLFVDEKR